MAKSSTAVVWGIWEHDLVVSHPFLVWPGGVSINKLYNSVNSFGFPRFLMVKVLFRVHPFSSFVTGVPLFDDFSSFTCESTNPLMVL